MEALPQSAFEAVGEIGLVWASNSWNVSTILSSPLRSTFSFTLSAEMWPLWNRAGTTCAEAKLLSPSQVDQWAEGDGEIRVAQMAWEELIAS